MGDEARGSLDPLRRARCVHGPPLRPVRGARSAGLRRGGGLHPSRASPACPRGPGADRPGQDLGLGGLGALVWVALKVGALSYGGGFVIIPLMQHDVVSTYHWMTGAQFLNAVALGQVTPGTRGLRRSPWSATPRAASAAALLAALSPLGHPSPSSLVGAPRFAAIRSSRAVSAFLVGRRTLRRRRDRRLGGGARRLAGATMAVRGAGLRVALALRRPPRCRQRAAALRRRWRRARAGRRGGVGRQPAGIRRPAHLVEPTGRSPGRLGAPRPESSGGP